MPFKELIVWVKGQRTPYREAKVLTGSANTTVIRGREVLQTWDGGGGKIQEDILDKVAFS